MDVQPNHGAYVQLRGQKKEDTSKELDSMEVVTIEEFSLKHMWEIAAHIEVLEWKGLRNRQELNGVNEGQQPP